MQHLLPIYGACLRAASLPLFLLVFVLPARAQLTLDDYQQPSNAWYWKNRAHASDYWQQDVAYTLQARLFPQQERVDASMQVQYQNNSPDTLTEIWLHLYQNAFTPGSHYTNWLEQNHLLVRYSENEADTLGTQVRNMQQDGQAATTELHNTLLKVSLNRPLPPGARTTLSCEFSTWFAGEGFSTLDRRMQSYEVRIQGPDSAYTAKHFNLVHWYPRIAVYDRQFRWHTPQHLRREFYGNFGVYNVSLTLPEHYILDGTGVLDNRQAVLPPKLRQQLDIEQYVDKPSGQLATEIIPPSAQTKTWRFSARNVHDVAYTLDPTYRIGEVSWNGVRCISLAQEEHAGSWQDAAPFARDVIRFFSEQIGEYEYPKIIVADARDGMEYPMLTLDSGGSPTYKGLLVHEIGHNWFQGMLGSNETYRALLDEGFTQFLTAWGMDSLVSQPTYGEVSPSRLEEAYAYLFGYWSEMDGRLNRHSNDFGAELKSEYGLVYIKVALMLYNLQYTLGEDLFREVLRTYVRRWKFRHPTVEDFRQTASDVAQTDLNWFFDQWLETEHKLDYALTRVKRANKGKTIRVKLRRQQGMEMPLDLLVITTENDSLYYRIPNTLTLPEKPGHTQLQAWQQVGLHNPTHTTEPLELPAPVKSVQIDPTHTLADRYLLNNQWGEHRRVKFRFMAKQAQLSDWRHYVLNTHPNLWWNGYAGLQPGWTLEGNYMLRRIHNFRLSAWVSAGAPQANAHFELPDSAQDGFQRFNYRLNYRTPLPRLGPDVDLLLTSQLRDGAQLHEIKLEKKPFRSRFNYKVFDLRYRFLYRSDSLDLNYLLYPEYWSAGQANAHITLGFEQHYYRLPVQGFYRLELRTAAPGSDRYYAWLRLESKTELLIAKRLKLRTRLFAQYADGALPLESQLYLAMGNPERQYEDDFYRARGYFPNSFLDTDDGRVPHNIHYGGGLNLRGYVGYQPELEDLSPAWSGNSGASFNMELEFDGLVRWRPRKLMKFFDFDSYLFVDGGVLGLADPQTGFDGLQLDQFRLDAGLGAALTVRTPGLDRRWRETILRFDMPFFLSTPPFGQDFVEFRWLVGIGRAF